MHWADAVEAYVRVTLHADVESDVAPELVRRALLDFSERRPEIWPQLDAKTYKVHWVDETSAEVT